MPKVRVPVFGTVGKSVRINPDATFGAQLGVDLFDENGEIMTSEGLARLLGVRLNTVNSKAVDHGLLTGLADDDHVQYLRVDGTRASTGAQEFTGGISVTGGSIVAGTVDADFDAITGTSYGGILEANLVDKTADETVPGAWTFTGAVTIDTDDAGPMLTLGDGANSDQDRLLYFNMDRAWSFTQYGIGASTVLGLRAHTGDKVFGIYNSSDVQQFYFNAGAFPAFRIYDALGTDYVQFAHDGTDANFDFVNTTDLNFNNLTSLKLFDRAQLQIATGDNLEFGLNLLAGATIGAGSTIYSGTGNLNVSSNSGAGRFQVINGTTFAVYDASNTDYVQFAHDGTDLTTSAVNTTDWNIGSIRALWLTSSGTPGLGASSQSGFVIDNQNITPASLALGYGIQWTAFDNASPKSAIMARCYSADGDATGLSFFTSVSGTNATPMEEILRLRGGTSTNDMDFYGGGEFYIWDSGATDALRLSHDGTNAIVTAQSSTSIQLNGAPVHITDTTDASGPSTALAALTIGPTNGNNIAIDTNEIMARNNGAVSTLYLNTDGGDINLGSNSPSSQQLMRLYGSSTGGYLAYDSAGTSYARLYHNGSYSIWGSNGTEMQMVVGSAVNLRTHQDGISVYDRSGDTPWIGWYASSGTRRGYIQFSTSATYRNEVNGADLYFQARTTGGSNVTCFYANPDGNAIIYYSGQQELRTADRDATGSTSGSQTHDHNGNWRDVGFNDLRVVTEDVSDTLEAAHAGGVYFKDGTTGVTLTLEASTSTDFPVGAVVQVINAAASGDITVTEGASTTLYHLDGSTRTDTAGGCTVGPGGIATIWREASTIYYIWGSGITP